MKMSGTDFEALNKALLETLTAYNKHPFMVQNVSHAWEVFHKAWNDKRIDGHALYKKYNDAHIETALNKIFRRRDAGVHAKW